MRKKNSYLLVFLVFTLSVFQCKNSKEKYYEIGFIGPLTGDAAYYGQMVKDATELAKEEINNKGGINGYKLKILYEDDQLQPQKGVSAFNKLVDVNNVPIVIQAAGSGVMLAEAPLAEKRKVVLISPTCSNDKIKYAGDYIFRTWPSDSYQGEIWARFAYDSLKARSAAIVSIKNEYGEGLREEFKKRFTDLGGIIILDESFQPSETNFKTILGKIKEKNPNIVFLPTLYKEAGLMLKQAKELNIKTQFVGTDGNFAPELIKLSNGGAEGMLITNMNWDPLSKDSLISNFVTNFRNKYKKEPEVYAAAGYDCLYVIAKTMEVGKNDPENIKNELYKIHDLKGVTGTISFDKYGEVNMKYAFFKVRDNQFFNVSKN